MHACMHAPLSVLCGHTFSNPVSHSHGLRAMLEMKHRFTSLARHFTNPKTKVTPLIQRHFWKRKVACPHRHYKPFPVHGRAEPARHFMRTSSFRLSAQNLYVKTLSDSPLSVFCGHTFSNLVSRSHGLRPMLEMKQGTLQIQKSKRCPPFKIHFRGTSEKQKWRAPTNTTDRPKSFRNQNVDSWW